MTLNHLKWPFCVLCFGLGIYKWVGVLAFGESVQKFAELRIYCQREKNVDQGPGSVLLI